MQTPKDIVLYLDSNEPNAYGARVAYAAALAAQWNAHLAVAFAPEDLALDPHSGFARGGAIENMLQDYARRREESEAVLRTILDDEVARSDITVELRLCEGEYGEALMLHARHAGLSILGAGRRPERQVSALTLSEDVIFASGRPCILLPADWPATRSAPANIVVGWNASREAARAIADAMPFLAKAQAVHVVVVPEAKFARLLGPEPGADISRHLARYGVPVALHRLQGADAGEVILAHARDHDADMIVVGAYGQSKITEFVFGSATQRLLSNPEIPILLSR